MPGYSRDTATARSIRMRRSPGRRSPASWSRRMGKSQLADSNAHAVTKFLDDHDIAWWSRGYIFVALQQGIVGGYPDNTYRPRNETTRAEACVMVENFLNIHK